MKGVDKAIYDIISNDRHIQAMFQTASRDGVNIYPYNPDIDIEIPSITFYESDSDKYLNIPNCEQLTYRIDVWTQSLDDSTRLGTLIDELLSVRNTTNEYARVCQFTLFTSADIFEDQTKIYHKSLTYKVIAISYENQ